MAHLDTFEYDEWMANSGPGEPRFMLSDFFRADVQGLAPTTPPHHHAEPEDEFKQCLQAYGSGHLRRACSGNSLPKGNAAAKAKKNAKAAAKAKKSAKDTKRSSSSQ